MRRFGSYVAALSLALIVAMQNGCTMFQVVAEAPRHCTTEDEWHNIESVDREMLAVFDPNDDGVNPWPYLYDRYDYLESRCGGINAYRNER